MKNKIRNVFLGFLFTIGILLVLFAIYGLLTYQLEFSYPISSDGASISNQSNATATETDAGQEDTDIIYKEGDIPEIDQIINEQIDYICNNTNFIWDAKQEGTTLYQVGYSGDHVCSYTNKTGIDFPYFRFWIMLYNLPDPSKYLGVNSPPDTPLEQHELFNGEFVKMQEIPISFTSKTSNYNYWYWTFEYKLPSDYNNPLIE